MSELEILEMRIRRTAVQDAIIGLVVLALALLVFAAAATRARTSVDGKTLMVGAVGVTLLWTAWVMVSSARKLWPPRSSRVYAEFSSDDSTIGWSHLTTGAFSAIKIYFLDGEMVTLYANERDAEKLLQFVTSRVPDVIIGYGSEQQAAYAERVKSRRIGA